MSGPTVGGLFAGYGGVELALHDVWPDARPVWFSQYDPEGGKRQAPSRILAHHWPDVPNHGDVTKIDWSVVEPVDIITGGFPCQDVSAAGKRRGLIKGATRSGLWGAMATAVDALRPRLVVIENVRGLLSAQAGGEVEQCAWCVGGPADGEPALRALGAVLGDLADLGYDAAWVGLRAADVGAPHGRFRVFVLAWPQGDTAPIAARPGAGRVAGDTPVLTLLGTPRAADGVHSPLRDPAEIIPGGRGRLEDQSALLRTPTAQLAVNGGSQHPDKRKAGGHGPTLADEVEHLLPTPAVNDMGASYTPDEWDEWTARMKSAHGNGNGHGASLAIEAQRMLAQRWGQYAPAIARWEALTRPAPDPIEPTGRDGAHRLSPRFVEWMMGLPAGHVTDPAIWQGWKPNAARNAQLKALGNGVVPQQCAAALRHLLAVRNEHMTRAVA